MGTDPALLFYPNDFLGGVKYFTMEERGKYITLLCDQFVSGYIPKNHMISVCGSLDSPILKKFKLNDDGLYFNQRLEDEKIKRINFCNSRRNNKSGRKKGSKNKITKKSYDKPMFIHMENENENENKDINKNKNEKFSYISKVLFKRISERRQIKFDDTKLNNWNNTVRLMIDRDKRSESDIINLINECHDMPPSKTGFTWADNILSMDKLRKQWNDGKIYLGMIKNKSNRYTPGDLEKDLNKDYGDIFDG